MLVLALDTASVFCSAALVEDGSIIAAAQDNIGKGHAEHLTPQLSALMQKAGKDFAQIDRIGVNIGPGSFTGVRVGVAAARALALALEKPAIGISAFAAFHAQALSHCKHSAAPAVYVVLKAPQNGFYWQYFTADGTASAPQSGTAEEIADFMQNNLAGRKRKSLVLGNGTENLAALLPPLPVARLQITGHEPTADIAFFALAASRAAIPAAGAAPVPLYMRAPDAKPQTAGLLAQAKSQFRAPLKSKAADKGKKGAPA